MRRPIQSESNRLPDERRLGVRLVNIGIGNVNSTVGALDTNVDQMIAQARPMAAEQVTVATFPEQVIRGMPPEDLIQWGAFVGHPWNALTR